MVTYTLSIEDRVGRGVHCTERAVIGRVSGGWTPAITHDKIYNPNKDTGAFNENGPHDTSFSITHSFKAIANEFAEHYRIIVGKGTPRIQYGPEVNDAQKILFENYIKQALERTGTEQQKNTTTIVTAPDVGGLAE